jgi:peroxiredoxin
VKHIKPILNKFGLTLVAFFGFIASLGLAYYVLMHLPIIDFRAYSIGNNFQENMTLPDNAKEAVVEYTWKFDVNGEEKEFVTNGSYPTVDGKYISVDTKIIDEGDEPLILDFSIESEDEDLTTQFLEVDNLVMIVAYNLDTAEVDGMKKLKAFSENAIKKGYTVIGLSSSGAEDKQRIKDAYDLNFDFYLCDEKVLKTIVRASPGVLTLKKGTVTQKEHWNDLEEIELETLPNTTPKLNFELKKQLNKILKLDQGIREVFSAQDEEERNKIAERNNIPIQENFADYFPLSREIDSTNMKAIKTIIKKHGYPGKSLVGEPENVAAWYVIQHSNEISKYLEIIKKAANEGEITNRHAAMMEDRYLMEKGMEQIYGTQGRTLNINTPNQISIIWPIKDFKNVNKRRKKIGYSQTIEDYIKDLYGDDFVFKNYTLEEVKKLEN